MRVIGRCRHARAAGITEHYRPAPRAWAPTTLRERLTPALSGIRRRSSLKNHYYGLIRPLFGPETML